MCPLEAGIKTLYDTIIKGEYRDRKGCTATNQYASKSKDTKVWKQV